MKFPLLGLTWDLHLLDNAHAERTENSNVQILHIVYSDKPANLSSG